MTEENIVFSFEKHLETAKMPAGKRKTLLAAMTLFAQQGFHGTSTMQVAEVAKVSQATVFKYFKTKEDLLLGVLQPMAELLSTPFINTMTQFDNKEDIVHFFIHDRFAFIKANRSLAKIILQELLTNPETRKIISKQISRLAPSIDLIENRLCQGNHLKKSEVIRTAIAPFFTYLMQMIIFETTSTDEKRDLELIEQQILKLLSE
ncbi:TPA: TetR/AcrR family transcriptional regulator [Streptococcus suis]|uniref:TetR family transcriptional regulator n=1 Tax=Streptococcus suis TaxID=1307 RepID=A0A116LYG2_STRSU|nr:MULTISPECIES: TetR/AcrR family transcriptional regulator [Streptococcus]MBM7192595.1 TetR/AcrR family transcriptional regulator [Streptococcus suis]MBY0719274.1 TetR/AcrR family transcriptional regulator [Streptococcus sp. 2018110]MCO8199507.1 TetR/AcrR family transcriptional regulator [Streptococcus suis]MCO8206713.1 TetR/AcrR family transcriptional regulator [Streptococcus suis]MCO8211067.1 TetR/AcrR family transcriptional regulator [Streptococcus suis]